MKKTLCSEWFYRPGICMAALLLVCCLAASCTSGGTDPEGSTAASSTTTSDDAQSAPDSTVDTSSETAPSSEVASSVPDTSDGTTTDTDADTDDVTDPPESSGDPLTDTETGSDAGTDPETETKTETETEESFEIRVPNGAPVDLTDRILGTDHRFDVHYTFGNGVLSDLKLNSNLTFVGGDRFTCDADGLTAVNTGWASVGLSKVMTQPYAASAHLIARENTRVEPAAAIMLGVRCPGAGNLHIDGGFWVMFREDSVYVHIKGGFDARLCDGLPGLTTDGVDAEILDDGSTLTVMANGKLLATASITESQLILYDAAGNQLASCDPTYVAQGSHFGYVRSMIHYANGTICSLQAAAIGEDREAYRPLPGTVALREGKPYGFRDLVQYKAALPFYATQGRLYADAALLANLFGFTYEADASAGEATFSREGLTLTFRVGADEVEANSASVPFPTIIRVRGTLLLSADWLAAMLGYSAYTEGDTLYILPATSTFTQEVIDAMNDRYKLYEEVVYNHDDVEADTTGVGRYNAVPPEERLVGIAYSTWHTASRNWGKGTWDLPLLGAYTSDDRDVIYQHGVWLRDAGVDFVFVDWSNNTCYDPATMREARADFRMIEEATDLLFEIWSTIPGAPKICIFVGPGHSGMENVTNGNHQKKVDQVYRDYVEKYPDMYFFYEGKPLLICYGATPTQYSAFPSGVWKDDRFTVRWMTGYVGQQDSLFNSKTMASTSYWSWEERGTQTYAVRRSDKSVEAVTVTAASRAQSKEGEPGYIPAYGRDNGATLKRQFQRACDLGARFVILVSWNEWTTGEQPSAEVSKDLEPSRIHGTFYYDLLCEQIKKFKGLD